MMANILRYYRTLTDGIGEAITAGTTIAALLTLGAPRYHGVAVGLSVLLVALGVAKVAYGMLVEDEPIAADINTAVAQGGPVAQQIERAAEAVAHDLPKL